ncbi:MAG: PBSX family phage terminase large subunit [Clostridia bacterium]|nr:PBSX family phage terminase large subunit [Clostridia bacterium]
MEGGKRVYLPAIVGGGYRRFWDCRLRYRVVKGGKASKKSSTAALWFILHLMKYPAANLLVVRNVYRTHVDSTFAQLRWAIRRLGVEHLWRSSREPLELCYTPTGQRILFRGLDNVEKLASTTVEQGVLCWVWIEEAYEIAREADFDKLDLSVPRGEVDPPLFKQTTITFNPWNENHWLKGRFFDRDDPQVLAMTTDYRCNEFLDETDRRLYERMRLEHPRQYAVAGLGEWGHSEGLVFENWQVEAFSLGELQQEGMRHVFGLDYGYTNDPTAFIAAAVAEKERRLYIYDEHYEKRMSNEAIAAMITRKGYQKERIRADSAEPKSNDDLRRLGIGRLQAAGKGRDSVSAGISRLQEYHILVHPRCVHTAAELGAYTWQAGGREGEFLNRPCDRDNHLMDALRYAMEDVPRLPQTPQKVYRYGLPRGGWK